MAGIAQKPGVASPTLANLARRDWVTVGWVARLVCGSSSSFDLSLLTLQFSAFSRSHNAVFQLTLIVDFYRLTNCNWISFSSPMPFAIIECLRLLLINLTCEAGSN